MQKDGNRSIFFTLNKIQVQVDKTVKIKTDTPNLREEKRENIPECTVIGGKLVERTLIVQAIRSILNKWDIMQL